MRKLFSIVCVLPFKEMYSTNLVVVVVVFLFVTHTKLTRHQNTYLFDFRRISTKN